jgi:hypothetical protein
MKTNQPLLMLAAVLLLAAGACLYLFGGPYLFVQVPLRETSFQHLQSSRLASSPADATDEYLHWRFPDRPKRRQLEIAVCHASEQEAVVTVINRDCKDDSLFVSCDRLTLRRQSGTWLPVQHQAAWQGRGRIGWTTQPTS